ncbi:MAG: magnesium/cobalt transporter CorA [Bacteroidota bacterium]|nr:magnesium/cobalt transporter CorA [Bacteroidota bacterium]
MSKRKHKHTIHASKKSGQAPGTIFFVGSHSDDIVSYRLINFSSDFTVEKTGHDVAELITTLPSKGINWIDINGLHSVDKIEKIGKFFNLHPLVLEDLVNTTQRPKAETFENYIFVVLKMLTFNKEEKKMETEQLSIVFGKNYVLTFQENKPGDPFEPIRNQLRTKKDRIINAGPDFLAYSLIDVVIDDYFTVLECQGDKIEELENSVLLKTDNKLLLEIFRMKREMMFMRKSIWPLREIVSELQRNDSELITNNTTIYLRDIYDHTVQLIDSIELYRDMLAGSIEIYLSSTSYRLNTVMKVLTVISTIFIPLTFITSIYGMNFEYMPELRNPYGYIVVWGIMIISTCGMLYYFKKKKWF